jgi:hypothetical protein
MTCRTVGLIVTITLTAFSAPHAPDAQPPATVYRIGFSPSLTHEVFRQGL